MKDFAAHAKIRVFVLCLIKKLCQMLYQILCQIKADFYFLQIILHVYADCRENMRHFVNLMRKVRR